MSFLKDIITRKQLEVHQRQERASEATLQARLPHLTPRPRLSLFGALSPVGGDTRIIAEVKRASPSIGTIDSDVDAAALGRRYAASGAAAISVLTDGPGFGGKLEDLREVREAVSVPLLRKDFILSRYQLLESRLWGADVVLLIVAALTQSQLSTLHAEAEALGLEVLVEVHDDEELTRALDAGARIVGVNNRNLATFEVSLATSERLLPRVPGELRSVSESGVKTAADVQRLRSVGAANFLIGEALVRAPSSEALLEELRSVR